jgi:hypothetical protein
MRVSNRSQSFGRRAIAMATLMASAACTTAGGARTSSQSAMPARNSATPTPPPTTQAPAWRVTTKEHVDLWLHGFAMLTSDTGHVPFFERGYKQATVAAKRQKNVFSQLDANQKDLSARFAANPALTNAQFLAMYFSSFPEMVNATDLFIRSQGNPRAASDPQIQQQIALLAANFQQGADRNWLKLFVQGLQDESSRFFHAYWLAEQQARGAAYSAFVEAWSSKYYPKLARFLNNTQQPRGEVVLSIPIGGEGRTINDGKQSNMVAVTFPRTIDAAPEALFVFVHEVVGRLANEAITDNTSPAEQRSGVANEYVGNGAVRGGALLLRRVFPELVPDYMRFYLRTIGRTASNGDPSTAFAAAFPLPTAILNAIDSQIGVALGGI